MLKWRWVSEWPSDLVSEWASEQVTKWPSDQVTEWWPSDQVTEWQEALQTIDRMVYLTFPRPLACICARPGVKVYFLWIERLTLYDNGASSSLPGDQNSQSSYTNLYWAINEILRNFLGPSPCSKHLWHEWHNWYHTSQNLTDATLCIETQ